MSCSSMISGYRNKNINENDVHDSSIVQTNPTDFPTSWTSAMIPSFIQSSSKFEMFKLSKDKSLHGKTSAQISSSCRFARQYIIYGVQPWHISVRRWKTPDYRLFSGLQQAYGPMTCIWSNLYIGSCVNAANLTELRSHNIVAVVNVAAEIPNMFPNKLTYLHVKKLDLINSSFSSKELAHIRKFALGFIETNQSVLIHCAYGESRSATVAAHILAHLLNESENTPNDARLTFADALKVIASAGRKLSINPSFIPDNAAFALTSQRVLIPPQTVDHAR